MPEISVIVPVYKVESYLSRCVESILSQSFSDFELILVDDGSPDRCGEMCDDFAQLDNRIHVIHRENGGLSAARNSGIEWVLSNSSSEYITFVDSDDWLHRDYLSLLYNAVKENCVDISVCRQKRAQLFSKTETASDILSREVTCIDAETLLCEHEWNFNYAWGKLYKKEYFSDLRYPEGKNFEDTFTTYNALFAAGKLAFVDCELYFYFVNDTGISRAPWTPKELVILDGMREQMEFYRLNGYSRALDKEEHLYVNHYAYQLVRIRENKADLPRNRKYLRRLRREMMRIIIREPKRFGYRSMPYCIESAYPGVMKFYHAVGSFVRTVIRKIRG